MKTKNSFEELRTFVKDVFIKAGQQADFNSISDIIDLNAGLRDDIEVLEDYYFDENNEKEIESFSKRATDMVDDLEDIGELWKYTMIFQTFGETFDDILGSDALSEVIYSYYSGVAESSDEAIEGFKRVLEERNLFDSESEKTQTDIDCIIGWFCLAIEASIKDEDEDGIQMWVTGFGNCFGYDNDVSDIISSMDSEFRDWLLEEYMRFLKQYFQIDTFDENGDFRDEDEGVDWDAVSGQLCGLL